MLNDLRTSIITRKNGVGVIASNTFGRRDVMNVPLLLVDDNESGSHILQERVLELFLNNFTRLFLVCTKDNHLVEPFVWHLKELFACVMGLAHTSMMHSNVSLRHPFITFNSISIDVTGR